MDSEDRIKRLVGFWRLILKPGRSWVLFEKGTCVICTDPDKDPKEYALEIMKEWGPVYVGTSAGDFNPRAYRDPPGILVAYHHPDILSFVPEDEIQEPDPELHLADGIAARHRRGEDAEALRIVHIEESK